MKLFLIAALISSSAAFAPAPVGRQQPVALFSAGAKAIEAAMAASKEHGPTSKEARVLWDIVEEMDASDNSAAYQPAVVDEEYEEKVKALSQMLTKTKDELDQMKSLADALKGVKLGGSPTGSAPAPEASAAMQEALAEARSASDEFGGDSKEAMLAWETVEELASSGSHGKALKPGLDEECLIEFIEGCEALEKFKAALDEQ